MLILSDLHERLATVLHNLTQCNPKIIIISLIDFQCLFDINNNCERMKNSNSIAMIANYRLLSE